MQSSTNAFIAATTSRCPLSAFPIDSEDMKTDRCQMTARVVPLRSDDASDARVGGTVAERLALVRELE